MTTVFKELYKNPINVKVVRAAIRSKICSDESIFLSELIYPEVGKLSQNKKFLDYAKRNEFSLTAFSNQFWKISKNLGSQSFIDFLGAIKKPSGTALYRDDNGGYDPTIYEPYHENFEDDVETEEVPDPNYITGALVSLVTATAEADEGWGERPVYDVTGTFLFFETVLVNDDFAFENPTHIIGLNGIEYEPEVTVPNAAFPPTGPVFVGLPREVKQVYVGDVRVNHNNQYDKLISFTGNGGGSEIRFTRSDGFLVFVDGQVQPNTFIIGDRTISRNDIKRARWVGYSLEWDGDWEFDNLQQNLAIFEEDNRNSSTFNGSLTTTITAAVTPITITSSRTIGFTITYKSDDYLIRQSNYNRDVFFLLNRINLEGEMYKGWPVRDREGNVSFTLNDRTLN